jgi:hypothetical protein
MDLFKRFWDVGLAAIATLYVAITGSSPDATVVQDVQTNVDSVGAAVAMLIPAVRRLLDGLKTE